MTTSKAPLVPGAVSTPPRGEQASTRRRLAMKAGFIVVVDIKR
jgi:hypothetical protein